MSNKIQETDIIQKYINASFSHPFDAGILKGNYNYLYLLLELDHYVPNYNTNEKIRILHAPSEGGIKGTKYVLEAIEQLNSMNVDFDFKLLTNKSHQEVIDEIRNSDILIDQMVAGWYGLVSIESMALGKTTVCYIKDKLYNYLPDLPIINLNPDNLAKGLKQLITNKTSLQEYGKKGRTFVEQYHDYKKNSLMILNKTMGVS